MFLLKLYIITFSFFSEVADLDDATLSDELLKLVKQSQKDPRSRRNKIERRLQRCSLHLDMANQLVLPGHNKSYLVQGANLSNQLLLLQLKMNMKNHLTIIRLPLRRPYSGDLELLDEKEFGEASASNSIR